MFIPAVAQNENELARVNNNVIQVDSIDKIQNKADLDAYVARFLDGLQMQDFNIREVF